jgi:hypothetical protein
MPTFQKAPKIIIISSKSVTYEQINFNGSKKNHKVAIVE